MKQTLRHPFVCRVLGAGQTARRKDFPEKRNRAFLWFMNEVMQANREAYLLQRPRERDLQRAHPGPSFGTMNTGPASPAEPPGNGFSYCPASEKRPPAEKDELRAELRREIAAWTKRNPDYICEWDVVGSVAKTLGNT